MKIHHLNCGTMRPVGGRLLNRSPARVICHCLLVDTGGELVLVDSGVGLADMEDPLRLGPMRHLLNLRRDPEETAVRQVQRLGYDPRDVGHILLTHLDLDHAGGIADFPGARIHVYRPEHEAATAPRTYRERERYRPAHFAHGPRWAIHEDVSETPLFGLACLRDLDGLPAEIVLVPLEGHTRGHCGVAVRTDSGWLLHAGDVYYHERQMGSPPGCPPGFRLFQVLAHHDRARARRQVHRLRKVVQDPAADLTVFCTHDPSEFERLSATVVR